MFDINQVMKDAELEVSKERSEKAKRALVSKLRALEAAKQVVRNVEAEIGDLKASIADGSFN